MATLTSSHSSYVATILENKLFINVCNLPLTSGHPSYTARISIPQGWPHKGKATANTPWCVDGHMPSSYPPLVISQFNYHIFHIAKGLVTNYGEGGGLQNGRRGACEVLPLQKGGGGKRFSHVEGGGGGIKTFGVVFIR